MKCPHCGANIGLEDAFCAYCGKPNEMAKKHQADMRHYQKEFTKTQNEIYSKSRKLAKLTAPFVILMILIALNIAGVMFNVFSWDIGTSMLEKKVQENMEAHQARIDEYIERGDYHGLSGYFNSNNLYMVDAFDEYTAVVNTADNYFSVYRQLVNIVREKESSYYEEDLSYRLKTIVDNMGYVFDVENQYSYRADEYLSKDKMKMIHEIQDRTKAILVSYGGLTIEESEQLLDLSYARRMELLERGLAKDVEE